jgi:hypothetical protein
LTNLIVFRAYKCLEALTNIIKVGPVPLLNGC